MKGSYMRPCGILDHKDTWNLEENLWEGFNFQQSIKLQVCNSAKNQTPLEVQTTYAKKLCSKAAYCTAHVPSVKIIPTFACND